MSDRGWVTISQAAAVFGVTGQGFRSSILPHLPAEAVRDEKPMLVHGPTAIAIWVERKSAKESRVAAANDPLLDGPSSLGLERYRNVRADLAELELAERNGQLIRRERAHSDLAKFAVIIRGAGEILLRDFGAAPHKVLDDALIDAMRTVGDWAKDGNGNRADGHR